jgi:hypothetical protein
VERSLRQKPPKIRALRDAKLASEIAKMYGLSPHRIGEILRGKAYLRPRSFVPRNGRFYPRINVAGRVYSLGVRRRRPPLLMKLHQGDQKIKSPTYHLREIAFLIGWKQAL